MLIDNETYDVRKEYADAKVIYEGKSTTHDADTAAGENWWIWKYTWDGADCTRIEGPIIGNWDGRADLEWGA